MSLQFLVESASIEKVAFLQDAFCALKEEAKPRDTKGRVMAGDLIHVLQGQLVGKEVFVKDCNNSYELVVKEKSKDLNVVVISGNDKGLTEYVSGHNYVRKTFWVQLVNGHKKNLVSTDLVH